MPVETITIKDFETDDEIAEIDADGELRTSDEEFKKLMVDLTAVQEHSPAATSEVGEAVDMTRAGAYKRLTKLHESGSVEKKKIAASVVWFVSDDVTPENETETDPDSESESESGTFGRGDGTTLDAEEGDTLPQSGTRQEVVPR